MHEPHGAVVTNVKNSENTRKKFLTYAAHIDIINFAPQSAAHTFGP